jgi:NADH:ubiquinone oxidoreductase subunit E
MDIFVCIGSACHLKGSNEVIHEFQRVIEKHDLQDKITLKGSFCLNKCTKAVSVRVDKNDVIPMDVSSVEPLITSLIEDNQWNT